jgi:hypothetical protein
VSTEPVTNQTAAQVETGSRWADDGGVLTEDPFPGADPAHPDTLFAASGAVVPADSETQTHALTDPDPETELDEAPKMDDVAATMETAVTPLVHGPLLTAEAEQGFLNRWVEIQVGFVEDPAESVRDADALIQEIADTLLTAFATRRIEMAADWQHGTPDTEELRLCLRRYRSFIGVILPK